MLGAAVGVPVGTAILGWANPAYVRASMAQFLVLYSLYALFPSKDNPDPEGFISIRPPPK